MDCNKNVTKYTEKIFLLVYTHNLYTVYKSFNVLSKRQKLYCEMCCNFDNYTL